MKKILEGVLAVTPDGTDYRDITIEDGIITNIAKSDKKTDLIAVPGFIDTHIHGFGGHGTEDCDPESIIKMSDSLLEFGVTSFFPTIYTDVEDKMKRSIHACYLAKGKEKGADIRGIHIEGPFISPKRIGAQNPLGRKDPSVEYFEKLLDEAPDLVKAMTMAPELPGAAEVARVATEHGVRCLCGHTNATYEETLAGHRCCISHATHLFNAMNGLHHRKPGTVGAVLTSDMTAEIIGDGLHTHPAVVKMVVDMKGPEKIAMITDSLRPTAQKEGKLTANDVEVELLNGLWVTKGNPDLIQGSAATMLMAFQNCMKWGIPLEDAAMMTSTTPARLYKLDDVGTLEVGKKAHIVVLNKDYTINEVVKG